MISLYQALAESDTEIAAIKLDWRINQKQDAQEAIRDFTQLLIDLTGHKYDVDRIVDLNDEDKEKQFRDLVVKAEDAPTFIQTKCLLNIEKKYFERITQFLIEICSYEFLMSEAGINWLDAVCGMTFAMLSYRGKGDLMGEWQTVGGTVRLILLKGLSDTRKQLIENKDKDKQYLVDLLVKLLPDVCKDLMVDEMDRIFTCPATAEWAAKTFFELMNKHTDLYGDEERFLDKYFKILTYEAKVLDDKSDKDKEPDTHECPKITKLALESLDHLLGEVSIESREKVIEFIRRDADTNMLHRMLNDQNLTMVRLCLRLVNAMQEAEGRESMFSEEASKEIHLLVLEKNKEVRASAARFMNLTMSGQDLLIRTLDMIIQYEVSTDDIFSIIDQVWDPEAFSQWKTYWTILCKDSRLGTSFVITKMITYVLEKMKNIAIINKQIAQKKMYEHVIDFVKTYGNCLKYLRNHGEWKKYKYFLCISDAINVEFYKPESIQTTKPLRIILEELLRAMKVATDTESIFKAISLFVRFDKVCKQGDIKYEENTYDGLINDVVPNSFNTLIQEFDQLKTAENASTQLEQSVIILGAAIHCGVQLTHAEMQVIFDQKLPVLLEPKNRKKFTRPCGLYILAFGVYIYFWRSFTATKAKKEVVRVTRLFDTLFNLFEDLLTSLMDDKSDNPAPPNFSCSKVFHFACLAFSILESSSKIVTPYITPEITLKRLLVLSRFIEFYTFERKRIGLIPQWTTMICRLGKHLPPNTATSKIVKYWVTADVADKEIFSLLKELKKQPELYVQTVTITLLDIYGNEKHKKMFLKKWMTLYDVTAQPGYSELIADCSKILVAVVERQKQLSPNEGVNRFEAIDKLDSMLNRVIKSGRQTQLLFNALKDVSELTAEEKTFVIELRTKLLNIFPGLK